MAIADKTRLRLLSLMREREISVCLLAEILGESQPKISRHLACLRNAGIVETRRDGKWVYYKIAEQKDVSAERVLREMISWLNSQENLRAEYEKLAASSNQYESISTTRVISEPEISDLTYMRRNQDRELETFLL